MLYSSQSQLASMWFLFTLVAYHTPVSSGQKYKLQIFPNENPVSKPSNQQFVLTCKGQGSDTALFSELKWYTPSNEEITNESINPEIKRNFYVETINNDLSLTFENPKPELSGLYTCRGLLQHSESLSNQIQVTIYEDITWDQCPDVQYLIRGNTGERVNCKASANPKPNIIWSKEGEKLHNNPRYLINSTGIVVKEHVTDKDGGVYTIKAIVTETGSKKEKRITVQIYSRPQIISTSDVVSGIEDDQIEMKCEASGVPQPLYSWFDHNRRNLSSVGGFAVDRNSGSLIISRLKKNVEGQFTCLAENSAGKNEKNTRLLVYIRPKIRSFMNSSYEQNKVSYIECRAAGEPRPKLTIRKDGLSRPFQMGDARIRIEERSEKDESVLLLTYLNTTRKDDGLYYCRAENEAGFNEMVGHLEVKYKPDLSLTPLKKVKTWNNLPVNISCIADAIPNATIKWFKNGYEILPNEVYRISEGSGKSRLFITPTKLTYDQQVFGTYVCEGTNSLGKGTIQIDLDRATVPGHVASVQTIGLTPTQVRFRIIGDLYDGGMPIKKITVEYFNQFDPSDRHKRDFPYSSIENLYIIDKLKPFTTYSFRFLAENEVGKGEFGQEARIQTKAESKPDKPVFHNLPHDSINKDEIVSRFPHTFTATWNLPADNGRKIQYFEVTYYAVKKTEYTYLPSTDFMKEKISLMHDESTTKTLENLKADTYYRLELVAHNDLGDSEPASIIFRTPPSSDLPEDEEGSFPALNASSVPMGLIAAAVMILIIIILLFMDIFFYCHYNVGAIYFLRTHICNVGQEDQSKLSNFNSPAITPTEISSKAHLRYSARGTALHRSSEAKQTIEVDNPAFDYNSQSKLEENSPMLYKRERDRFPFRSDLDSAV